MQRVAEVGSALSESQKLDLEHYRVVVDALGDLIDSTATQTSAESHIRIDASIAAAPSDIEMEPVRMIIEISPEQHASFRHVLMQRIAASETAKIPQ